MPYLLLKDTYTYPIPPPPHFENYGGPITLSLPEWQKYVAKGYNTLFPGVIPGGTMQTAGGASGAVYTGHVRQGITP